MGKNIITNVSPIITPVVIASTHSLAFDPGVPAFIAASPTQIEPETICIILPGSPSWLYFKSPITLNIKEKTP